MADPHWENLKELFHAALILPPHERSAFLQQATNGDNDLREAVESLLKSHEETHHLVDTPAYQAAAEMLVADAEFQPNQTVAHYRIVSLLGEGGMGKVYLAEDTKLRRPVALKFLPQNLIEDQDRLRRFEQEARATSALNHPNILTIFEIGDEQSHRYIATEYIEGETLRSRLRSSVEIDEALDIAIQIASALVAAHRVGIVHRDIKPENIMIRRDDGIVKVLDFGLAKTQGDTRQGDSRQPRVDMNASTQFMTGPGVVMGTVAYMSPEQARGEVVDRRTDIWSLGVLLYEMIAGSSPFIAATSNEIISMILGKTPTPRMTRYASNVPERLEEIVEKALTKSREERYQTSQDLLNDLKKLRQSLQIDASDTRERSTESLPSVATSTRQGIKTTGQVSSAEYIVTQVKAHKRGAMLLAGMVLLAIVSGAAIYQWRLKQTVAVAAGVPKIKSLAVLPLKSLDSDQSYVGVGIADAVIRKISQTGQLTVRPTSSVIKYVKEDKDSLTAARELNTDAILEGTVQRAGDRLRVTVNLLRASDGSSLYTDNFDLSAADVFVIQDKVAQQVASRLQISFESIQQVNNKYPTDPRAYEAYIRGVTSLDERGYAGDMPQMQSTIDYFKQSIAIDPKFPLSHAKLAFAYAWTAAAIEPGNNHWAELAKEQLKLAQDLDPNVAETHFAHAYMLWTAYEGYQTDEAIRELLLAKQLNPNSASPDLPAMLGHIGLDDLALRELQRALVIDPTNQSLKDLNLILPYIRGDADAWYAYRQTLPSGFARVEPWYYMRKGQLDDAQKAIDERMSKSPEEPNLLMQQSLMLALRNRFPQAEARIPEILAKVPPNDQGRHHLTYGAACVFALSGKASEAVKWLKETANTGFPNYSLFARDPFLDRIRKAPEFVEFMTEQSAKWEKLRAEFGS